MTEGKDDLYAAYLLDLGTLLREYALEAKARQAVKASSHNDGYLAGFHRVLSLMEQQAEAFGIPASALGLADFDPDAELV